ncbi:hypothetical protein TIFTF001_029888 [Ficus carica]|uniref:Uncharacterized protein n=1 Tax=Ficus carica TaxID=3494 RepID=A0AA88DS86_FICCA|nr:hypothetical protein TIFTF001_029888 [Ficus carica]
MQKALKSVPRNPDPQRGRWFLSESRQEDDRRDQNEGQVPHHVQHQNRLRVRAALAVAVAVGISVTEDNPSPIGGGEEAAGVAGEREREGRGGGGGGAYGGAAEHGIGSSPTVDADIVQWLVFVHCWVGLEREREE